MIFSWKYENGSFYDLEDGVEIKFIDENDGRFYKCFEFPGLCEADIKIRACLGKIFVIYKEKYRYYLQATIPDNYYIEDAKIKNGLLTIYFKMKGEKMFYWNIEKRFCGAEKDCEPKKESFSKSFSLAGYAKENVKIEKIDNHIYVSVLSENEKYLHTYNTNIPDGYCVERAEMKHGLLTIYFKLDNEKSEIIEID